MKHKPGDWVKITTKEEVLEGVLMPRPEMLAEGITVIKRTDGYNMGIEDKRIVAIKVLKPYQKKKAVPGKLTKKKGLPTVSIISTGGTISSKIDYATGGVYASYTARDFVSMCPELLSLANIEAKQIMSIMSEDIHAEHWKLMAKAAVKELSSTKEGVIMTHGTDTLHFSSAALSFFIRDINKPLILTAAQRSIDRGSSDAHLNLICSTLAATRFNGAVVGVCMHGTMNDDYCLLHRGTKVRKMHTSRRDAFRSINERPLAKVWPSGTMEILHKGYPKRHEKAPYLDCAFEDKVAIVPIYPGADPNLVHYYLDKAFKGLVISATALGHIPTLGKQSFLPALERAKEMKIPIVIASQTLYGRVHPYVYTNLRKLSIDKNCIFVGDMLPEVAYIKLGWVLGHSKDLDEVRKQMTANSAGELSQTTSPVAYLS